MKELRKESGLQLKWVHLRPLPVDKTDSAPAAQGVSAAAVDGARRRTRLSDSRQQIREKLLPFEKHWPNETWSEDWSLYWLHQAFRNHKNAKADSQFLQVFERLIALILKDKGEKQYTLFESQLVYPHLIEHFVLKAMEYVPLTAIGYVPGTKPNRFPRYDDIQRLDGGVVYRKMMEKKDAFQFTDAFPDAPKMYNLIVGDHEMARRNLMGRGGYAHLISKCGFADLTKATQRMMREYTNDPLLAEIPIVMPIFNSASFTSGSIRHLHAWFPIIDLYVAESPEDNGMLIVSNRCLDEPLIQFIEEAGMKDNWRRSMWRKFSERN